jgi:hypothetical protein
MSKIRKVNFDSQSCAAPFDEVPAVEEVLGKTDFDFSLVISLNNIMLVTRRS